MGKRFFERCELAKAPIGVAIDGESGDFGKVSPFHGMHVAATV